MVDRKSDQTPEQWAVKLNRDRERYWLNVERERMRSRKTYYDNPPRHRKNPENKEMKQYRDRRWYENNKVKVRLKRNFRRSITNGGGVSVKIIDRLFVKQEGLCAYNMYWCDVDLVFEPFHVDHIIPLKLSGAHEESNLQLLCVACNLSKSAKHPDTFVLEMLTKKRVK